MVIPKCVFATILSFIIYGCDSESNERNDNAVPVSQMQTSSIAAGVYFSTNRSGNYEIVRLHDGNLEFLTTDATYDSWWPRQSPSGETMLFYRSRVSDRPESGGTNNNYDKASLWSLDLKTGTAAELIPNNSNGWVAQGVADWSPDGSTLIMAARLNSTGRWHLFTTNSDGSNQTQISNRTSLFLDPSWSPDGSKIVYVAFPPDYPGIDLARLEVYIADANGLNSQRLTNDNLRDHDPYWSPDGNTIAFETAVDPLFNAVGRWAIRTASPTGGNPSILFDDANISTLPRWNHDGSRILFHRFIFGSGHGFIVASMLADGSDYQAVTLGGDYDDTDLDWFRRVPE